jgi:hypothetical protein
VASLFLGLNGWAITRLWLWLLGSALFVLVGVQLMLFWMLIQVLDAIDARDERIGAEMTRAERAAGGVRVAQSAMGRLGRSRSSRREVRLIRRQS